VAYTATPFANVFINPDGLDREVLEDLYPRDFILALDKPHRYVGAEDLFGRPALREEDEKPGLDVIVTVDEGDVSQVVAPRRRRAQVKPDELDTGSFQATVPQSMEQAIQDFILAGAGLLARHEASERPDIPLTMLIHSSHSIAVHQDLGAEVTKYVEDLRREWRYDRGTRLADLLRRRWDTEFKPRTARIDADRVVSFSKIEPLIGELLIELQVKTVNSQSDDVLDYELQPGVKTIVVGGNRLSRGLTLENLLVSYFVRQSPVLDTLLQMGRWFGHRGGYVDLTRIYTTPTLVDWFREVAAAEEELREDIRLYAVTNRTPRDFGPRVRSHAIVRPTSPAKMQHAREVGSSFAGQLKQTILFQFEDRQWLERNLEATRLLLEALGPPHSAKRPERPLWQGVSADLVLTFLSRYRTSEESKAVDSDALAEYIRTQNPHEELTRWDIAVVGNESGGDLGVVDLAISDGHRVNQINRSRLQGKSSIGTLVNPALNGTDTGDEATGMTRGQLNEASRLRSLDPKLKYGRALRRARDPATGLLLIYPISPMSLPKKLAASAKTPRQLREPLFREDVRGSMPTVIGIGMVFPDSDSIATDQYFVGPAGAYEDA
jgi:hypothetical protein